MRLLLGDCLELLKTLPDNSVDSIVTDPPYGLGKEPDALKMLTDWVETGHHDVKGRGFMGKEWDAFVPQPRVWHECLRVLKPGGHLLAFAGTRTQDLMALGLRLAGFEIRDMVAWVYGSGFPKSANVSKMIDKMAGSIGENILDLKREIRRRYEAAGMTLKQFNEACGFEASGYLRETSTWASVLPPAEKWAQIKAVIECDGEMDALFAAAEREVTGYQKRGNSLNTDFMSGGNDITAPATDAAKQWDGWGTALKPALEPITLARKPLEGTVAANVLKWHTGALNIDGCRVGVEGGTAKGSKPQGSGHGIYGAGLHWACEITQLDKGRWPANLIHDGSEDVMDLFPETAGGGASTSVSDDTFFTGKKPRPGHKGLKTEAGSAARFFYCAKANKKDRGEGNNHPTVKPTDLMRYLCRLITPPNGVILDPYMGSGSTGKAAVMEGFDFIGMDSDPAYFDIAQERIATALANGFEI